MMTNPQVQKPLGKAGIAFFSSLCIGTFGLGVWQTQRYFEKIEIMEEVDRQMALPPTEDLLATGRRIRLRGKFDHEKEFYVGPRGSPTSESTGSLGVPRHGYFVWTPLSLTSGPGQLSVLVNRGWVSKGSVDGDKVVLQRSSGGADPNQSWSRPIGEVDLVVFPASQEAPRFLVPQHGHLTTRKLFWLDRPAMSNLGDVPPHSPFFVQIQEDGKPYGGLVRPTAEKFSRPKLAPETHAGYAFSWYAMSLAGVFLTRKLILKR